MALEEYHKANGKAKRYFRNCVSKGIYPYLQVLDDILENTDIISTVDLGVVSIPADQIVGTRTEGRKTAFARNFMPLLGENTEFARKWETLCNAHLQEGIRSFRSNHQRDVFHDGRCFPVQQAPRRPAQADRHSCRCPPAPHPDAARPGLPVYLLQELLVIPFHVHRLFLFLHRQPLQFPVICPVLLRSLQPFLQLPCLQVIQSANQ